MIEKSYLQLKRPNDMLNWISSYKSASGTGGLLECSPCIGKLSGRELEKQSMRMKSSTLAKIKNHKRPSTNNRDW